MKKFRPNLIFPTILFFALAYTTAFANNSVSISEPSNGTKITGPVHVCLETSGVEVEPAKMGVHKGKGHHHLLVDVGLPKDLTKPIGKDANHIHMGDGSKCKKLNLPAGKHTIRALFAKGNHVPYNPALTTEVMFNVK